MSSLASTKQLENFAALYRCKNMTKAADELYMTRQALSNSIASLEEELDVVLFVRSNKGLLPTREGDTLYRYCEKFARLKEELLAELGKERSTEVLRVALHLMYYPAESLRRIKYICRLITGANPILLNMTNSGESRALLEEGRADVVMTHKPPEGSRLLWKKVFDDRAFAIMRVDDPLAAKVSVDFTADFTGRTLTFPSVETMREVEPILAQQNARCSFIHSDRVLLKESILSDRSVMVIPEQSIGNFLSEGMTTRLLTNFPVTNGLYIIYREQTATISRFAEEVARWFSEP